MTDAPHVQAEKVLGLNSTTGIKGYRDLTDEEKAVINDLKDLEQHTLGMFEAYRAGVPGINQRSISLAVTNIQTGFMWAIRSIARPNGE